MCKNKEILVLKNPGIGKHLTGRLVPALVERVRVSQINCGCLGQSQDELRFSRTAYTYMLQPQAQPPQNQMSNLLLDYWEDCLGQCFRQGYVFYGSGSRFCLQYGFVSRSGFRYKKNYIFCYYKKFRGEVFIMIKKQIRQIFTYF